MGRAPCCDKANVKKGPWSPEEDAKLKDYIEKYGTGGNWIALPQKVGLKRCGKSCRLRWLNYLRPNIKHGGFTEEEDRIICSLYISIGSRWSIIAAQLPGRTDNDIKNYWNTKLKKKLLGKHKNFYRLSPLGEDMKDANGINESQLSNSALERLQLHMELQKFENSLPFYNNPALWPRLHPLQDNITHNMQPWNGNMKQDALTNSHMHEHKGNFSMELREASMVSSDSCMPFNTRNNFLDCFSKQEQSDSAIQQASTFQSELEDILNSKTGGFMPQDIQAAEFDYFKELNGGATSKDGSFWWPNDLDSNSTSSWDSSSVLQPEGMIQDYELGYNM